MKDDAVSDHRFSGKAAMRYRSKRFRKPVVVQPGRIDRDRVVVSVLDAADVLLHDWPKPDLRTRHRAIQACLAVLRNQEPPRVARQAFIAAAEDARILLGDQS
ncbi:DUF982 domain-containing protein [Mesorhizobium sp. CA7]|uniref:DUF982 domain-containing protein n=1 Tax=Mesorhizobium sp. CA7 TaxID=588501 RepID=UPI001CCE0366|nr:DUF982 domain-containing protein [Mesorhizobium sp. CA7]MBZ9814398.1 DUF982 domain-containing protein [Mesorhizobium sp. CA7]